MNCECPNCRVNNTTQCYDLTFDPLPQLTYHEPLPPPLTPIEHLQHVFLEYELKQHAARLEVFIEAWH